MAASPPLPSLPPIRQPYSPSPSRVKRSGTALSASTSKLSNVSEPTVSNADVGKSKTDLSQSMSSSTRGTSTPTRRGGTPSRGRNLIVNSDRNASSVKKLTTALPVPTSPRTTSRPSTPQSPRLLAKTSRPTTPLPPRKGPTKGKAPLHSTPLSTEASLSPEPEPVEDVPLPSEDISAEEVAAKSQGLNATTSRSLGQSLEVNESAPIKEENSVAILDQSLAEEVDKSDDSVESQSEEVKESSDANDESLADPSPSVTLDTSTTNTEASETELPATGDETISTLSTEIEDEMSYSSFSLLPPVRVDDILDLAMAALKPSPNASPLLGASIQETSSISDPETLPPSESPPEESSVEPAIIAERIEPYSTDNSVEPEQPSSTNEVVSIEPDLVPSELPNTRPDAFTRNELSTEISNGDIAEPTESFIPSQTSFSYPPPEIYPNPFAPRLPDASPDDGTDPPREPPPPEESPSLTLSIFSSSNTLQPWRHRFWTIGGALMINLLLPFVNGVMLGFGEIFARDYIAASLGFGPGAQNRNTGTNVGLSGSTRGREHDHPGHAGFKTAAEAAEKIVEISHH